MNISVFGGAFDPPHLGHQAVVENLLATELADEVWYLPVKNHHFGKKMAAAEHRLAMLKLVIDQQPSTHQVQSTKNHVPIIRIEDYELHQEGINYTYDTLVALSQQYPEYTFSFVIGSDNLAGYERWLDNRPKLLDFPFFVYPRAGYSFNPLYQNMTPLVDMPEVTVSSTEIREARKLGKSLAGLVTPEVEEYIKENKLYQ